MLPDPNPLPDNLDTQVWHIDETGEWFLTYGEYLERLDFYTRHNFTCEITGTSCLTFFEALDSEETQFRYVEVRFPIKLREPVARFLHFNETKRIDALVEQVYTKFKNDFFPGEVVYLRRQNDSHNPLKEEGAQDVSEEGASRTHDHQSFTNAHLQKPYIIKEKVQFNETRDPNTGEILAPAHTKYMLVEEYTNNSIIAEQHQIFRDRTTFTKHLIKCFFKITLHRASSKMGAPWCVKPEYITMYGLNPEWPPEMLKYKDDEGTPMLTDCKSKENHGISENGLHKAEQKEAFHNINDLDVNYPAKTSYNTYMLSDNYYDDSGYPNFQDSSYDKKRKTEDYDERRSKKPKEEGSQENIPSQEIPHVNNNVEPTPTVITSIVDDMVIPYNQPACIFENLHFLDARLNVSIMKNESKLLRGFRSVGKLIYCYQFLNTFNERLLLTNFSFDQFLVSIKCTDPSELAEDETRLEINNDVADAENIKEAEKITNLGYGQKIVDFIMNKRKSCKCSISRNTAVSDEILDNYRNNGSVILIESFQGLLRQILSEEGDWTCIPFENYFVDDQEDKNQNTPENTNENGNKLHKKNDSKEGGESTALEGVSKSSMKDNLHENDKDKNYEAHAETEIKGIKTDLIELSDLIDMCLNYRGVAWTERLTKRQFANGSWILCLIGVFYECQHIHIYKDIIRSILSVLIPKNIHATQLPKQLWRNFCRNLDFEEKTQALWILCDLVLNFSTEIKSAIDESMDLCSQIRSERFKVSKELKANSNHLQSLEIERYRLQDNESKSDNQIAKKTEDMQNDDKTDTSRVPTQQLDTLAINGSEDKQSSCESVTSATATNEIDQQIKQQAKKVELLQADKVYLDKKLMQYDLQRLISLGMDRYGNKYYWLDANGVPINEFDEELTNIEDWNPQSGRLWIQGPTAITLHLFLGVSLEEIESWKQIRDQKGCDEATEKIFKIKRGVGKSYYLVNEDNAIEVVDEEGLFTGNADLTPIQRKLIDETPSRVLLSEEQWYMIETYEDFTSIVRWLDGWGRREHDLLRQLKQFERYIHFTYEARRNLLSEEAISAEEDNLMREFEQYEYTADELALVRDSNIKESRYEPETDNEEERIDDELEKIADKILELDDSSGTRKVLTQITALETERDKLLKKKREIVSKRGPDDRTLLRAEKKRLQNSIEHKTQKQNALMSKLLNYRHHKTLELAKMWKNHYTTTSAKAVSGPKKTSPVHAVEVKLKKILSATSRTSGTIT